MKIVKVGRLPLRILNDECFILHVCYLLTYLASTRHFSNKLRILIFSVYNITYLIKFLKYIIFIIRYIKNKEKKN